MWQLDTEVYPAESVSPPDFYELYKRVSWAMLGVNTNALAAAQIPILLRMKTNASEAVVVENHPLMRLFAKPNRHTSQIRFLWRVYSFLWLTGNAFIELNDAENPTSMKVIRPDRVTVKRKSDGSYEYEIRRSSGSIETVPEERMVHIPTFNPSTELIGVGHMTPATDSAIIELYLLKYDRQYYESAERPKQVITMPDGMYIDDKTLQRLKTELQNWHSGVTKFHRTIVLEAGMELNELRNPSHADTDFIRHKKLNREDILAALGCWPLVALLKDSSNRALLSQAYRMFYDLTIFPMAEVVRQEFNLELVPRFDRLQTLELVYQYQMLKALRDDLLDISSAAYRFVQLGILTPNEVRLHLLHMRDRVAWGDRPPKTALYQMPGTMFESNPDKAIMEEDLNRARARTLEEHQLEASGLADELRNLVQMKWFKR